MHGLTRSSVNTHHDVDQGLFKLKTKKATGQDELANEYLKATSAVLQTTWRSLMNACLQHGVIPSSWRESTLVMLYKGKRGTTNLKNYRGIANLCTTSNLLTSLMNRRIMENIKHLLLPEQFGFRPGSGTADAISKLMNYVAPRMCQPKGKVFAAFIDFASAFDCLERSLLIRKLHESMNIKGRFLRLIANILENNSIRIFDGLKTTERISQTRGVYQGDSMSPTLFICYVADLADRLRTIDDLEFSFYADDLIIYSELREPVQLAFEVLHVWSTENKIEVNMHKTKAMKFRLRGRYAKEDKFSYAGETVEFCSSYEYLGIILQPSLTFTKHLQKKKSKALGAIGSQKKLHEAP